MCFTIRQEYIVREGQELGNICIFLFLLILDSDSFAL